MKNIIGLIVATLLTSLLSCKTDTQNTKASDTHAESLSFSITNLSDTAYPDNPDIGYRAKEYKNEFFTTGKIDSTSKPFIWSFEFYTLDNDTIALENINISEYIPTVPSHIKKNAYMSHISCINQEWNRNQVRFSKGEFGSTYPDVVHVDLARNCLNAYLWEIILYINEDNKTVPYAHGWFNFPHKLYADLFEQKNAIPFATYQKELEQWSDPENHEIELDLLRKKLASIPVSFKDLSDKMYPLAKARKKKYKEIIHPKEFNTMRDLQSDSTVFAMFTPPGYYNRKAPRKTELGRFYNLKNTQLSKVKATPSYDDLYELTLDFEHKTSGAKTSLIIGGLDLSAFPVLDPADANSGWKSSMGIGNHTFYETYQKHVTNHTDVSPYYAMLLDKEGKWIDSHKVGIDGPIFHFSDEERKVLNVWLLSFERHALVGHYEITRTSE